MIRIRSTAPTATHSSQEGPSLRRRLHGAVASLLVLASLAIGAPAFGEQQNDDTSMFLAGFKLYQQKDYAGSLAALKAVVEKYPETQLRDLALYWLSRSYYRNGNLQEAARCFSQFAKEFPKSPLKELVDSEMAGLVARYERGEKLPTRVVANASTAG